MAVCERSREIPNVASIFEDYTWWGILTCISMACMSASGPEANPIRMPEERILDKLSKRRTRPTSGSSSSRLKYEGMRGTSP